MIKSLAMIPVIIDAKKGVLYREHFGLEISSVIEEQKKFWGLDEDETKYLVIELDKWNKRRVSKN